MRTRECVNDPQVSENREYLKKNTDIILILVQGLPLREHREDNSSKTKRIFLVPELFSTYD